MGGQGTVASHVPLLSPPCFPTSAARDQTEWGFWTDSSHPQPRTRSPLKPMIDVLSVPVICSWNIYSPGQLAEVEWWPGATHLSLHLSPASVFPVTVVLTTLEVAKQGSQPSTVYMPESGVLSVTPRGYSQRQGMVKAGLEMWSPTAPGGCFRLWVSGRPSRRGLRARNLLVRLAWG